MFDCTLIWKSLNAPLPEAPKKKPNKEDKDDDKKDPDGFRQPANVVNVIFGGDQASPSVHRNYYYVRSSPWSLQFRDH